MRVLKIRKSFIVMATGIGLVGYGAATAQATQGAPEGTQVHKVWVCHATDSDSNPYLIINPDVASATDEGHFEHQESPNKRWKDAGTFGGVSHAAGQAKPDVIGVLDAASAPAECFDTPSSSTTSSSTTSSSTTSSSTTSSTTSSDTTSSGTSTSSATTTSPDEVASTPPPVVENDVIVKGVSATATPKATRSSVSVRTAAVTNPIPAAAGAGEADTSGQLALGGLAGLGGLLAFGSAFALRRRRGVV